MKSKRILGATLFLGLAAAVIGQVQAALPAPPIIAVSASDGAAVVQWQPAAGASDYVLYWGTSPDLSTKKQFTMSIPGVTSPFTQTQLNNGTAYYFLVASLNKFGESVGSNIATAVPTRACPPAQALELELDWLLAIHASKQANRETAQRQQLKADIVTHSLRLKLARMQCK